ncbi:hypothetical protein H2248_006535 [Termitomyces sp. 'cryptogamus']|nr:hypothetical protein H2248_006535 [Termitomyces sp. 'cryptogamus']
MTYELVNAICNNSSWSWDDQGSIQVTSEKQRTWDTFVDKNPEAEPFVDVGWIHLETFDQLAPATTCGTHVYWATCGLAPSDDEGDGIDSDLTPVEEEEKSGSDNDSDTTSPPPVTMPLFCKSSATTTKSTVVLG